MRTRYLNESNVNANMRNARRNDMWLLCEYALGAPCIHIWNIIAGYLEFRLQSNVWNWIMIIFDWKEHIFIRFRWSLVPLAIYHREYFQCGKLNWQISNYLLRLQFLAVLEFAFLSVELFAIHTILLVGHWLLCNKVGGVAPWSHVSTRPATFFPLFVASIA